MSRCQGLGTGWVGVQWGCGYITTAGGSLVVMEMFWILTVVEEMQTRDNTVQN